MRNRFRFRAYEKSTNTMIYDVQESYDSYQEAFTCFGYESQFDLMQCTGLKDRKDNLIYEGDLVRIDNSKYAYEVIWIKKDAQYILWNPHADTWWNFGTFNKNLEVVGCFHENPEILDKEF